MCEGVFREVKLRCPHRIWVAPFYGMRTQTEGKKERANRTPAFISLYFLRAEAISPATNTAPIVVTVPSHCEPKQTCLPLHCFLGICQSKEQSSKIYSRRILSSWQTANWTAAICNKSYLPPTLPYIPIVCTKLVGVHLDHLSISNCFNSFLLVFKVL